MLKTVTIGSLLLAFGISECGDGGPCDGGAGAAGEGIGGMPTGGEVGGMGGTYEEPGGAPATGGVATGGLSGLGGAGGSPACTVTGWVTASEWSTVATEMGVSWPIGDLIGCPTSSGTEIANCVTREEVEAYCTYCGGHLPLYSDLDFMDLLETMATVYLDDPASSTGCGNLDGPGKVCPVLSDGPFAYADIGVYCQPN